MALRRKVYHETGENYIMRSFLICTDQIKKDKMNKACVTCGRKEKHTHILVGEALRNQTTWKTPDIDSRILKGISILRLKGADCILLVQERDKWRAVVNRVINLQVPQNVGNFFTSC